MKSLRLHKYTDRLLSLTYEELLNLTEDELRRMEFTDGARGKFMKHLALITERPGKIRELRKTLDVSDRWSYMA